MLKEWDWKEHFSGQPENLRYCEFLADKFDLRRDITFNARVKAAHWDEAANEWEVTFEDGGRARARFLITAIGPLSSPTMPVIPGVDDFKGESWHTGLWPHHPVSFANKRVAVIGTGASGVQAITEIAKTVGHLTVFQRTPNWCTPLRNSAIAPETMADIRARYAEIFAQCRENWGCFVHAADPRHSTEVSPEEREAFFEKLYNLPGFAFWQGNFRDVLMDKAANDAMTAFVTRKIRARLKDQKIADKLIPTNHGYGTRRVPLESGYYEVYNQPNVKLVDLRETPIERITEKGLAHQRRRLRLRHDHLRDRLRRHHRRLRPHRLPRPQRREAAGQVGRRAAHLSRPERRGLPQPADPGGPAQRGDLLQPAALHRAERRVRERPFRLHARQGPDAASRRRRTPRRPGPRMSTTPPRACC